LEFNGANEYLFARSLASITITGTNLSTDGSKHALWWINGSNKGDEINASVTDNSTSQSVTFDLTSIDADLRPNVVGEWELLTQNAYLDQSWHHSTVFGLTPAVEGDVTITNIELTMVEAADIYTRTISAGKFGTICLPKQALPAGATVYSATNYEDGTMTFTALDANAYMTAGEPYLFKATSDNPTFTMSGEAVSAPVSATYMVGTFEAISEVPHDCYVVSGTNLYKVNSTVSCGANRAYIKLPDNEVKANMLNMNFDGMVTAISETPGAQSASGKWFDLSGRSVRQNASRPLKKGIYITNGRKVFIK